jgi:hypothetical protein
VRAGDETRAAHLPAHRVREIHELHIEGLARIGGGVLVRVLGNVLRTRGLARRRRNGDVQEVMVEHRRFAEQAGDGALHQGQVKQPRRRAAGRIGFAERGSGAHLWDLVGGHGSDESLAVLPAAFADAAGLAHELGVDVVRNGAVEAQEAARHEARHLGRCQQDGLAHAAASTIRSKKNSYFR